MLPESKTSIGLVIAGLIMCAGAIVAVEGIWIPGLLTFALGYGIYKYTLK